MEVRPSQRAQSQTPSSNLIQPQFFSHSLPQDTLAAAKKTTRAGNCVATLGTYLKSIFSFIYEFCTEILSALGFEPSSLDIIKIMFYDSQGNAQNFVDSFKDSLNACVQAVFFDAKEVKELIDNQRLQYRAFCKTLKLKIEQKGLQDQLDDYRKAVLYARNQLLPSIEKVDLNLGAIKDNANFVALSGAFRKFCSEIAWLLKKSESCKKKGLQEALKHLFSDYFPRIALEINSQPKAYSGFMKALCDLKELKGKPFVALLETHFKTKDSEEKKHLETVFGGDEDVMRFLTDDDFASSVGLRSPINWKEIFLRAVTPEQFEALIPLYRVDEAKGAKIAVLIELFKQIKETEESITFKRLDTALGQLYDLFHDFEEYTAPQKP